MPPPNQTQPEAQPQAIQVAPQSQPATPEQVEASTRGQTRTELAETKNKNKLTPEEAKQLRDRESWKNNSASGYPAFLESTVRDEIKSGVAKELSESPAKDILEKAGFTGDINLRVVQTLMEKIVNEYYLKNNTDVNKTKAYLITDMLPKISDFVDAISNLFIANKDKCPTIQSCMEQFGAYCGIEFIKNGTLDAAQLETVVLLTKPTIDRLTAGFITEINEQNASRVDANTDIQQLITTVKLNSKVRVLIGADLATQEQEIKELINAQLPSTLDPQAKEKYLNWAFEKLKENKPVAGETREITEDGKWSDPLTPEQITQSQPQAQTSTETAEQVVASADFKTGIGFVDTILDFVKSLSPDLHKSMVSFLQGIFPQSQAEEFPNLDTNEKTNAKSFQETVKGLGLDMDTFKKLFADTDNLKKVLTQKVNEKIEWDEYLKKYLTSAETDALKKKDNTDTDSGEKIANMLLSINPEYQPPPTTPPSA